MKFLKLALAIAYAISMDSAVAQSADIQTKSTESCNHALLLIGGNCIEPNKPATPEPNFEPHHPEPNPNFPEMPDGGSGQECEVPLDCEITPEIVPKLVLPESRLN